MSVKVVQGLIGSQVKTNVNQNSSLVSQNSNTAVAQQSSAAAQSFVSTEAVNLTLRSSRPSGSPERIKDYKEAKEVSEQVAERVRKDDSAKDAHSGLTSASGATLV